MKEISHNRKVLFGPILFLLICSAIFILYHLDYNSNHFYGQFSGIVPNDEANQIVVCDIETGTFTVVKDIEPSEYIEYATVNDKGTKVAYTKWNDTLNNQYVIIESDLGDEVTYGKVEDIQKFSKIHNPILIQDGEVLICVRVEEKNGYPIEKLVLFDINQEEEKIIDSGELVHINSDGDDDYENEAMQAEFDDGFEVQITNQIELDDLLKEYHARQIEINDAGTTLFVQYSRPTFDAKNDRIIYAKTLYRNVANQGDGVILSSVIWAHDIISGKSQAIYEADDKCLVGKIDISPNGSTIAFSESMHTGENGRILELSLNASGEVKCLVEPSKEHYVNIDAVYVDDRHITYLSIAKDDWLENAVRYLLNLQDGNTKMVTLEYRGKPELIKFFNRVY